MLHHPHFIVCVVEVVEVVVVAVVEGVEVEDFEEASNNALASRMFLYSSGSSHTD